LKHLDAKMFGLLLLAVALAIGATLAIGQAVSTPNQPQGKGSQKAADATTPDRGQQVYQQNCARCHSAPQGFSPSISGTVAMHMRVRARLSDADYKALLHFLNP
jgi:mono/diheme cytochrome c family protein